MPQISRLVFSGGGARGAVYPGAYAALKETGVFDTVTDIAGSSAGAFTAALLSIGISPTEFQRDLVKLNFKDLLGESSNNAWITKDGKPLLDFLRQTINSLVLEFLETQTLESVYPQPLDASHPCWTLFQKLKSSKSATEESESETSSEYYLTFADLEQLVFSWPNRFKRLTVTAAKENGGELKLFNCFDTPHVEIALACRASGALPIFLTSVEIDGEKYVDGGIHDNIPTEFFDKNHASNNYENRCPQETLVFAFLEGDQNKKLTLVQRLFEYFFGGCSVFKALYGTRKDEHDNMELFKTLLNLVEAELKKNIESNNENLSLEALIDQAVDTVSSNYNYNFSWISYVWGVIVSAIIAVWTYIYGFFSGATIAAQNDADTSIKKQNNNHTYFKIIRDKLKDAIPDFEENLTELSDQVDRLFGHVKETIDDKVHTQGPNNPPILFDRHGIEMHAYNIIPKWLSPFTSNYSVTDKIEAGFQKLRSDYPLRTVALGIGNISAIDFDHANKHTRFMSARGYLDTINSISNLELYRKWFDPDKFYSEIIKDFTTIYSEVLETANQNPELDSFLIKLDNPNLSTQEKFHLIKEAAESDLDSHQTFALTRAVEYRREEMTLEDIFKEIDTRCGIKDETDAEKSIQIYTQACHDYLLHLNSYPLPNADVTNKITIINEALQQLNSELHAKALDKVEHFREVLIRGSAVLSARRDSAFMTFVKALGLIAVTIFTLGIASMYAYHSLFGNRATEGRQLLTKLDISPAP